MDDDIGLLPYMVTVTSSKPITSRPFYDKGSSFLETLTPLRYPGPWQVGSKKFRQLPFLSNRLTLTGTHTRSIKMSNQHAPFEHLWHLFDADRHRRVLFGVRA